MMNNKIKTGLILLFLIIGTVAIIFYFRSGEKSNNNIKTSFQPSEILDKIKDNRIILKNEVIVEVDEDLSKVNVETGEVLEANEIEKNNFSDFSGLPKQEDNGKKVEQNLVIFSHDKSKVIVNFVEYDATIDLAKEANVKIDNKEYVCDISQKKCESSSLLSQAYLGIDLKDESYAMRWVKWDARKNLLFGHLVKDDMVNVSPVYVCSIKEKTCQKSDGFNLAEGVSGVNVPEGAFSPSLEKFVVINQNDESEIKTGKKWELLLFSTKDLSKPEKSFDISMAINRSESEEFYDSVYSVAWNQDENILAIGTKLRIYTLDLEKDSLSLAYIAPTDESGDAGWNNTALFLSPDGKSVVFATEEIDLNAEEEIANTPEGVIIDNEELADGEEGVYVIGVLKKIDLSKNNSVSELLRGYELSLELQ